ncbi:unnamed protein product [Brassica rapa]|uniref:Glutathione hydrolase n=1 Tax=Brassica campestris TaxID=3711 RepID=A0A8D9D9W1_BRACM|nr:unnamed protein product [Brassica rapa]
MWLVRAGTIAILITAFLQIAAAKKRPHSIVKYHGAVATDDGRCSKIGMKVLRQGGNAIDASVAAALCLGVVSPASSGIGGGSFIVVKMAGGKEVAYDSRETAPLRATENMYGGNLDLKKRGALSVGVPGEVAGLFTAWKQHGKLPWKRLVSPAKKLADRGFKITKYLYMQMNTTRDHILADKGLSRLFVSNGELKKPGTLCRNPKLALTLRQIAKYGPKAFYNGTVGVNLVSDILKSGGIITLKDLQSYRVNVKEPLSNDILGYRLLGMPPPSSGGAAMVLILNILSQYGVPSGVSGYLGVHRLVEALKHAFAIRMNLGDPDFVDVTKVVSDMLSPQFAQDLKRKINDKKTFDPKYYGGRWNQIKDHGTSHLSIIDHERNCVSMTSTINAFFGALMLSPSTGIVLNNEMDDFSIPLKSFNDSDKPPPAPANFIRPGKRPLSSMTPTIVLKNGKVKAAVGASGGMYIIAGTTEVFLNHFLLNMDPLSSVVAPRIYHQLIPNSVKYENWTTAYNDHFEIPKGTRHVLEKKGHVLTPFAGGTISQFIVQESDGKLVANMYDGNQDLKKKGALSVAVPGEVAGLFTAWTQHGKLPWKKLVNPARKLAAKGFKISKYLYMQMNATSDDILADKGLSELFVSNGKLRKPGTIIRNPKLACTLKQIGKYGSKAFYNGTVGEYLVRDIQKSGGIITLKDLQSYKVKVKEPLSTDILGFRLLGMPPPSSGGPAMVLVLNILSQYGVPSGVSGPLGVHRLVKALKHAFAIRMNLGDPDFVDVTKVVSDMLSPEFAKDLKKKISDERTFKPKHYGAKWNELQDHGTSHLSIIDKDRNAVSMTNTVNYFFGALMLSPSTGIVLNNEMDDFSIPMKFVGDRNVPLPAPANFIRPGKRPLSSMAPTIVLKDGKVKASVGASGGIFIIAGTTEVFLNHFFLNMDPLSSVLAPRIYHQLIPNRVLYENWTTVYDDHFEIPKETRDVLEKKGHVLAPIAGGMISQFIVQESDGKLVAVSDPRKGGFPSGY